jgi:biopolymer transport protein ExbD
MSERNHPEINAGSMADIAFLLLIFFLVTTTLDTELGIVKRLPEKNHEIGIEVNEKNVLEININSANEILIEGKHIVEIESVRQLIIDFIDNGAGTDVEGNKCSWCNGKKDIESSDHPDKAIIKLQSNRNTSYASYIALHNEIIGAYSDLRNRLSQSLYGKSFTSILAELKKDKNNKVLHLKIKLIKAKYPQHILEEEPIE